MYTIIFAICLLPALTAAQGYGGPPPDSTSSSAPAASSAPSAPPDTPGHMNIDVAFQTSFVYHPNNITAPNGTLVTFWFPDTGLDHSVTESSFDAPCTYLASSGNSSGGFDSGLQSAKQFTINITDDTKPIFFHCKQVTHCGLGMVGSINAPSSGNNTFDNFMAAALKIGNSEVTEQDNGPVTGGVGAVATAPPASSTGGTTTGSSSGSSRVVCSVGFALFVGALATGLSLS